MLQRFPFVVIAVLLPALLLQPSAVSAAPDVATLIEAYLVQGELENGAADLAGQLEMRPDDDQARLGLGVIQFLQGVERLGQSLHRHGARQANSFLLNQAGGVPILRLPVPANDAPQPVTYQDVRRILSEFGEDLMQAEATLAPIEDSEVKLPLHFGMIRLDLNGDGMVEDGEALWRIFARYTGQRNVTSAGAQAFVVCLDQGDVHWLRGYCHLLAAMTEIGLAYDWNVLFENCGHRFFPKAKPPHEAIRAGSGDLVGMILDEVAFVHLISFPLREPERLRTAHSHLLAVIDQSRASWAAIEAETDNEGEWVPNSRQVSVAGNARVTQPMIDGWRGFLDEAEKILRGRQRIPFWRGEGGERGVNLNRVFQEPRDFDLILWLQGSAAVPYLEQGECTQRETWERLQSVFGGDYSFLRYAAWFN